MYAPFTPPVATGTTQSEEQHVLQTLLFVLGPFLLQAGIGLAAVYLAVGFVATRLLPKARLLNAQRKATEALIASANARHDFTCALEVAVDSNALLRDDMPDALLRALHSLPPHPDRKSLT